MRRFDCEWEKKIEIGLRKIEEFIQQGRLRTMNKGSLFITKHSALIIEL